MRTTYLVFTACCTAACAPPVCPLPECSGTDAQLSVSEDGSTECMKNGFVVWKSELGANGMTEIHRFSEGVIDVCCEDRLAHSRREDECSCWMSPCPAGCVAVVADPPECVTH